MRKHLVAVGAVILALLGAGVGAGVYAAGALSTGSVSVCATATTPAHTIAVDGNPVSTIPGASARKCATTTYTIPTATVTVGGSTTSPTTTSTTEPTTTSTTEPTTTTAPTTTSSPPPPPPSGVKGYYDQGYGSVADWNSYKQYGFNLAFVPVGDIAQLKLIAADGAGAWVQPNIWQGCGYSSSTSQALAYAKAAVATGAVKGFYVADEPSTSGCSSAPSQIAAWTAALHQNFPGIPTVISAYNSSELSPFKASADEFALDVYPCQYGSCNYSVIGSLAAAADKLGIKYVGVPQAFGGDGHYTLPTPAEEQQILDAWKQTNELGYVVYAFSAAGMPSADWLQNQPGLLSVIAAN